MSDEPLTRASLLVRLRGPRDERAWSEFVVLYAPLVRAVARRGGLQPADAADLEQEVFGAVAQAIERFEPDPARGSFRGWLARIARNRLLDGLSARRRQAAPGGTSVGEALADLSDPGPPPDATALFEEEYRQQLFRMAVERVRPRVQPATWAAFWRTAVEGETVEQVAGSLGLTAGAVYVHRNRVMARLREIVRALELDDS